MDIDEIIVGDISTPEGREEIMNKVAEMTMGMDEDTKSKVMHLVGQKLDAICGENGREVFLIERSVAALVRAKEAIEATKQVTMDLAQRSDEPPHIHQFGMIEGMLMIACGALHTCMGLLSRNVLPRYQQKEAEPKPASPGEAPS